MRNRLLLPIVASFLIASPVQAAPLTWSFSGTTSSSSQFNGMSIAGLDYELRVFLDTDLVGFDPPNLSDIMFDGPHQAQVEIATLGVLPVNMIPWVEVLRAWQSGHRSSTTHTLLSRDLVSFKHLE